MIEFRTETFSEFFKDAKEHLLDEHYEKLATLQQHIPVVDVAEEIYLNLESKGMLHVATARDGQKLAGYYVGTVMPHPHYKTTLFSFADAYYLAPEFRIGNVGMRFLRFIEESLRKRGVQCLTIGTKKHADVSPLLIFLGYEETDRVFRKWIQETNG